MGLPKGKKATIRRSRMEARKSTLFSVVYEDGEGPQPENCIHEGYLLKSVPVFNGMGMKWRKRFCKIFDGQYPTLTVSVKKDDETPDESIPLDEAKIRVPNRKKNTGVSFVFEIKNKKYRGKEGHLFAMLPNEGEAEREEWLHQMQQAGIRCENQTRCQLLEFTEEQKRELDRKVEEYKLIPRPTIETMEKELQEEENRAVKELKLKYADLKLKLVELLGTRFGEEFSNMGKVVPHDLHSVGSPLQKPWSVLGAGSKPPSLL